MTQFTKAMVGGAAAAAVALASATPAIARDSDGIGTNEIIAGALIIGGIAAAASVGRDRDYDDRYGRTSGYGYDDGRYDDRRYDDRYRNNAYGYNGNPRQAVAQCVRTAEQNARRYGRADVTDVRDIKRTRHGFEVKGRIAVVPNGRNWRNGDREYGNGWGGDYRGYDRSMRGADSGNFKCRVERNRVVALDYSGIRGL